MSDINTPQVTPASAWKSNSGGGATEDVPLPSGNVAKLRRPGMEAFITAGIIPNSLLEVITKQMEAATKAGKTELAEADVETLFSDPSKLNDVMTLVDNVLVYCVVEPRVAPIPVSDDPAVPAPPRNPNLLYPDMVDMEDKFFIFNYSVGGTRDLERFRGELASSVDNVRPSKPVVKPTKRTGGAKKR